MAVELRVVVVLSDSGSADKVEHVERQWLSIQNYTCRHLIKGSSPLLNPRQKDSSASLPSANPHCSQFGGVDGPTGVSGQVHSLVGVKDL